MFLKCSTSATLPGSHTVQYPGTVHYTVYTYSSGFRKKSRTPHAVLDSEKRIGQNTYLLSIILGL